MEKDYKEMNRIEILMKLFCYKKEFHKNSPCGDVHIYKSTDMVGVYMVCSRDIITNKLELLRYEVVTVDDYQRWDEDCDIIFVEE